MNYSVSCFLLKGCDLKGKNTGIGCAAVLLAQRFVFNSVRLDQ